jgi:hypothetical protein
LIELKRIRLAASRTEGRVVVENVEDLSFHGLSRSPSLKLSGNRLR